MASIIDWLTHYKYLVLFPLAIVEGPIIAVIAGFLCSLGYLNLALVFPVIVIGDIIGDSIFYTIGRLGVPSFIKKAGLWVGVSKEKMDRTRDMFNANPIRAISLSKIILSVGVAGIYLAGNAKVPFYRFLFICLITSGLQYVIYLTIGFLFGGAYIKISHYLNVFASLSITISIALLLFFLIRSRLKNL